MLFYYDYGIQRYKKAEEFLPFRLKINYFKNPYTAELFLAQDNLSLKLSYPYERTS